MIHSTSLRATGSEIAVATAVALLAPPLRRVSIAFLTSATSASDVCSAGACASGADGGWASPVPVSRVPVAQTLTVGAAPKAPGPSGGVGTAAAALLADDLLPLLASLDFPAAGFFAADFALLAFAVTVDEFLAPPRWALASAYWVIASRLAQASAATSADRYRVKAVPPSPGDNSPPACYLCTRLKVVPCTWILAEKRCQDGICGAVRPALLGATAAGCGRAAPWRQPSGCRRRTPDTRDSVRTRPRRRTPSSCTAHTR